ncbi:hypothetical protein Cgig2_001959 [Carnegiea gigantea]|uniref:Uncharacterized protein n=1 Tax=Carnegiea gigantea TaxID=171969 RepID=A0A9Q1JUT6_9CARY|nr:hypothetical protein Cgig2_001959 [Carnegiea gigantea]
MAPVSEQPSSESGSVAIQPPPAAAHSSGGQATHSGQRQQPAPASSDPSAGQESATKLHVNTMRTSLIHQVPVIANAQHQLGSRSRSHPFPVTPLSPAEQAHIPSPAVASHTAAQCDPHPAPLSKAQTCITSTPATGHRCSSPEHHLSVATNHAATTSFPRLSLAEQATITSPAVASRRATQRDSLPAPLSKAQTCLTSIPVTVHHHSSPKLHHSVATNVAATANTAPYSSGTELKFVPTSIINEIRCTKLEKSDVEIEI